MEEPVLQTEELTESPPPPRAPTAIRGLFLLAVFYTIYLTRSLLLPIMLATLLTYLLAPLVRGMAKLRIPRGVGSAVVLAGMLALLGVGFSSLVQPAAGWLEKAPYSFQMLQQRIHPLKEPVRKVTEASAEIEKMTEMEEEAPSVTVKPISLIDRTLAQTPTVLASFLTMLILLYFLLTYEDRLLRNIIRLMPTLKDKQLAAAIARDINLHVSRYLFTINPIFLVFGLLFWTWLWGIPGTLLAVPILVTFQIFCAHIERLHPVRDLLEK